MTKTDRFSFPAIKSKPSSLVNRACALLSLSLLTAVFSATSRGDENLPDINAKVYSARVERRSSSGRVYLLSIPNPGQQLPSEGHVVLLKQGGVPVMAFRVLKEYPDKIQFAGKWLRRYGDVQQLTPGTQYDAIEKISDREPPALTHQDQKDLKELEAATPAPAPEPAPAPAAPPVLAVPVVPAIPEVAAQTPPAPPPTSAPLPTEPTSALPPTAPLPPEVAAPVPPPPLPAPTAAAAVSPPPAEPAASAVTEASPLPEVAPAPLPIETPATPEVAETPAPPADLAGPPQIPAPALKDGISDDIPAPVPSPEPKTKSFDPELDATTSPEPEASPDLNGDDMSGIMVEEVKRFDEEMNALSVGVGLYRNVLYDDGSQTTSSIYNSAGTIRYSRTLAHLVHFKTKHLQDNLSIDGSLGFYKYLGVSPNGDTYTVMPISLELRYTLLPSEDFGFFVFGGFVQNEIIQTINPDPNVQQDLKSFLPDAGIGMLFRIGPSWYMRGDAGIDYFGFSIALKF